MYIYLSEFHLLIVKLQSQVQTSVLGIGVDFVLPLSQQQQEQHEQQEQEEPPPKLEFVTKDRVLYLYKVYMDV